MAKKRDPIELEVLRAEWLTPGLRRLVLGGAGFAGFTPNDFTDAYVKLRFGPQDAPELRTYTVREVDVDAGELVLDFVVHGSDGLAGPWARDAAPGDKISLAGPGGAYRPDPEADWHLLVGDESALPAIAAAIDLLPADAVGQVIIEVDDAEHQIEMMAPEGVTLTWLHRTAASAAATTAAEPAARDPHDEAAAIAADTPLARAVRSAPWLSGQPHVFVHGEAHTVMRGIRPYIRNERGVPSERASISGYWRRGLDHQDFGSWKREFAATEAPA